MLKHAPDVRVVLRDKFHVAERVAEAGKGL